MKSLYAGTFLNKAQNVAFRRLSPYHVAVHHIGHHLRAFGKHRIFKNHQSKAPSAVWCWSNILDIIYFVNETGTIDVMWRSLISYFLVTLQSYNIGWGIGYMTKVPHFHLQYSDAFPFDYHWTHQFVFRLLKISVLARH